QGVKDRIAAARKELALITTYEFTAPKGATDKLKEADEALTKARQPEQFAAVLNTLNQGLAFAAPVKAYYETRLTALAAQRQVDRLPNLAHPVMAAHVAEIETSLKKADEQLAATVVLQAVDS